MEGNVVFDELLDAAMFAGPRDCCPKFLDGFARDPGGRQTGCPGLEDATDLEQFQDSLVFVQISYEGDRFRQQAGFEARDVRSVAASNVEYSNDFEGLYGFTHRTSRQSKSLTEFLLRWQSVPRAEFARQNHVLYSKDCFVGDSHIDILVTSL